MKDDEAVRSGRSGYRNTSNCRDPTARACCITEGGTTADHTAGREKKRTFRPTVVEFYYGVRFAKTTAASGRDAGLSFLHSGSFLIRNREKKNVTFSRNVMFVANLDFEKASKNP